VIQTNLATRPFYNERAVRFWLLAAALLVAVATIFNVAQMIRYSRSDTELARQAANDETRASELRADAARLRGSVDTKQIELSSVEARRANELIDRRIFSWTEVWNRFEATLPPFVRITSFRRQVDSDRGNVLTVSVIARNFNDVEQFIDNLENTGAFMDVAAQADRVNDAGQVEVALEMIYLGQPAITGNPEPERGAPGR
jgi:Tfp pilus assembly protein PilN